MINIVDKDLFDSKANFIVHQVNCQAVMGSGIAVQVAELYPHVEKEYLKYCRLYKKRKISLLGTVQYVPVDNWAIVICDTMRNERIVKYDNNYQYIVNLFGQDDYGTDRQQTDLNAFKMGLIDIREKAERINASVALPFGIGSVRGGAKWNDVYKIIQDVFKNSFVDVEICRLNKG